MPPLGHHARGIPVNAENAPVILASLSAAIFWWWICYAAIYLRNGRQCDNRWHKLALWLMLPLSLLLAAAACLLRA